MMVNPWVQKIGQKLQSKLPIFNYCDVHFSVGKVGDGQIYLIGLAK